MSRGVLAILCSLVVACGARVVMEEAAGGAGGSGAGGGGTGGGDDPTAIAVCKAYCARWESDGCIPTAGPCEEWCPAHYAMMGPCADAYLNQFECFANEGFDVVPQCYGSTTCAEAVEALFACKYPAGPCEPYHCTHQYPYTCVHNCGGSVYESECDGHDPITCTCKYNGETIGTCEDLDLQGTCCVPFYAAHK